MTTMRMLRTKILLFTQKCGYVTNAFSFIFTCTIKLKMYYCFFLIFLSMCMIMCTGVQVPTEDRNIGSFRIGVTERCEPPNANVEN